MAALLGGAALTLAGCGDFGGADQEDGMARRGEGSSKRIYEDQQRFKRERAIALAKTSPTYPRPERDPAIRMTDYDGKIAYLDEKTGDILVAHSAENERRLIDYAFRTASGELVAFFKVQIISGSPEQIDFVPYRLYAITENQNPSEEALDVRKRISPARFAQFLASDRWYIEHPEREFIVIEAPLEAGERLL